MWERFSQSELENILEGDLLKVEKDRYEKHQMVGNFSKRVKRDDEGDIKMKTVM